MAEKMQEKLQKYANSYNDNQRLLKALQKDKETQEKKLADLEAKAAKIATKEKSLQESQESLDVALTSKNDIERQVSELNDELVSTSSVYFEWAKNPFFLFYRELDMSKLYFLQAVKDGKLVDEEVMASLEPKGSVFASDTQGVEGGKFEAPQSKEAARMKVAYEEES